mgnify:CR=1 FL=1
MSRTHEQSFIRLTRPVPGLFVLLAAKRTIKKELRTNTNQQLKVENYKRTPHRVEAYTARRVPAFLQRTGQRTANSLRLKTTKEHRIAGFHKPCSSVTQASPLPLFIAPSQKSTCHPWQCRNGRYKACHTACR